MDQNNLEDITLCNEREEEKRRESPPSPKRPRTEQALTTSSKSSVDFPELLTFPPIPSLTITSQKNVDLMATDVQDVKPQEQPQDTKLSVTPITQAVRSSKLCFITAEGHFSHPQKCEQSSFTGSDKLSSYSADDADGALAESHTSEGSSADTSSHPDCQRRGKSLDDQPPGGCSPPSRNDGEDGGQVQNNVSHMQAVTVCPSDEQARCQSDYAQGDARHDAGCNACDQSGLEDGNQEESFSENIISEEEAHLKSDAKLLGANPDKVTFGNLTEGDGKEIELQISDNSNVCDAATKDQGNEHGMSKIPIAFTVNYAEKSVASNCAAPSVISADSASPNDLHVVQGERTSGETIAEPHGDEADHTTETALPARISQESAQGDNDAGPFIVIDPPIWSETDRVAEKTQCSAESSAGVELSPSVKVSEIEMPLPLCSDVWPLQAASAPDQSEQCFEQTGTQQCECEEVPQSCSASIKETCKSRDERSCQWERSPSTTPPRPINSPPTGDARQQSCGTVACQLKDQDQSRGLFGPVKTLGFECSPTGTGNMEDRGEIKERDESCAGEIKTNGRGLQENDLGPEQRPPRQTEPDDNVNFFDDYLDDSGDDMCESGQKSQLADGYLGETLMCLPDSSLHRDTLMAEGTAREKNDPEAEGVYEEIETDLQLHGGAREHGREDEQESSCFPECPHLAAETPSGEDKDETDLCFLPTSDAVVPGSHHSDQRRHRGAADGRPAALNPNDRCSLVPSAFLLYERALGGFDTFEKIQLAPDEDDDDDDCAAGLAHCPLATSLQGQLPKTPQQELPCSQSNGEEEDGFDTSTEDTGDGFLKSEISCKELADFILAEGVIEREPDTDGVHAPDGARGSQRPAPRVNHCPDFDTVLKELKLFFDISRGDLVCGGGGGGGESPAERRGGLTDASEGGALDCKDDLGSPEPAQCRHTSSDVDEDGCLKVCGADPAEPCVAGRRGGEQEVPRGGHLCQQACPSTAEQHKEPQEAELKRTSWSPSFMCLTFLEQQGHRMSAAAAMGPTKAPQPLRTCKRPIRLGLSKRAKTRRLHVPHPYK